MERGGVDVQVTEGHAVLEREGALFLDDLVDTDVRVCQKVSLGSLWGAEGTNGS